MPANKKALQHAIAFAKRGWSVFPITAGKKDRPLCTWSIESTSDIKQIERWANKHPGCNWGLATGPSGLTVVDIDSKPNKDGFSTLFDLEFESLTLPKTLEVTTPSGGKHLYYEGEAPNTVQALGPGVDTRGRGGYVLIPGSYYYNGDGRPHYYEKTTGSTTPAKLPAWVTERIDARNYERDPKRGTPAAELDLEHNIERARDYLTDHAPAAIEGDGGDNTTYQVACRVRELGVSEQTAVDLMLESYNPRCIPEWSADELETKISNAYQYARQKAAAASPEAVFDPVDGADDEAKQAASKERVVSIFETEDLSAFSAAQLGHNTPPPREWVLEGKGGLPTNVVGVIAGQGGCGKTLLLMQLACSIASGVDCMGGSPWSFPKRGPVVLVLAEDPLEEIERRIHRIRQAAPKELDLSQLYIFPRRRGLSSLMQRDSGRNLRPTIACSDLKKHIEAVQPILLGLDSFSILCGEGETDNADGARVMDMLADFCHAGGECSTLILHHVSKVSQSQKGQNSKSSKRPTPASQILHEALSPDAVRGASSIVNNSRWVLTMTRAPEAVRDQVEYDGDTLAAAAVRKTNYSSPLSMMWWGNDEGLLTRFEPPESVTELQDHELMDMVVERAREESISRNEFLSSVRLDMGLSRDRARSILERLHDEGRLTWAPPAKGRRSILEVLA